MENFFYSNKYYSDLDELLDDLDLSEDGISELPDDYLLDCRRANLEPIITLSVDWIGDRIDEERFSEDADEVEEIQKILSSNIDFEKINSLMPKLYYESREKFKITKADLIEYLK
jgi:hypothetical protein